MLKTNQIKEIVSSENLSIYVHYPFCKAKCPYCDFNSHVREGVDYQRFLRAYERELEFFAPKLRGRKITTIFFGGGTPSLMPIFLVEGILKKISELWPLAENCEISLEANPTSSESSKFKALRDVGVNRLSMGIQALNDEDLKFLGRKHSSAEAISTIEIAAKIFDNFSFDLIYARPKQTLQDWSRELNRAIGFGTKHLSLYQLTIEKGTKFFTEFQQKKFIMPDENLSADFYEMTNQIIADNGLELYEISNYAIYNKSSSSPYTSSSLTHSAEDLVSHELRASQTHEILGQGPRMTMCEEQATVVGEAKKDYRCKHNLVYWQGGDYLGIGAGAHSRVFFGNELRSAITMLHEPLSWLKKVEETGAGIQKLEKISQAELQEELILMGLRLREGIPFKKIFNEEKLQKLVGQGFLVIENDHIKIPDEKRILSNSIIQKVCEAINDS